MRRLIKYLIDISPENLRRRKGPETLNGFSQLMDSSIPIFFRISRVIVLLVCFSICTFQIYTRFCYYLSEPVAVDVTIEEDKLSRFPSLTLGSVDTEGAARLVQEYNISLSPTSCATLLRVVLEKIIGLDTQQIWRAFNFTPAVTAASLQVRNQKYNLTSHEEFGHQGIQVRFESNKLLPYDGVDSKIIVKTKKFLRDCKTSIVMGSIQPDGALSDKKNAFTLSSLTSIEFAITLTKIIFHNRRQLACTDDKTYLHCMNQCASEKFRMLPCRFPFLPETVILPSCISGPGMGNLYGQTLILFETLYCQCPRRCHLTVFHYRRRYIESNQNNTIVSLYLANNRAVVITERLASDIISFLGEIGGILGLCLGLSLPSIIQICQNVAFFAKKSKRNDNNQTVFFNTDPFLHLVKRILLRKQRQYCNEYAAVPASVKGLHTIADKEASPTWRLIWLFAFLSCTIGSCMFVYMRAARFWSVPTRMMVQIVNPETVQFPTITICGITLDIVSRLKDLAKKRGFFRKTSFNHSIEDWCDLHLIDLVDDSPTSANKLWKESSILDEYKDSQDFGVMFFNKSLISDLSMTGVTLPDGECVEIDTGKQLFGGSNTAITRASLNFAYWYFKEELNECNRNYETIFITPPDEIFHLNTRQTFPNGARVAITVELKKVSLWNTSRKPCIDRTIAHVCYKRCFAMKLEERIFCRLPYMPLILEKLPPCNSSRSVQKAHKAYLNTASGFDALHHKDCGCIQSCDRSIISYSFFITPHDFGDFTFFSVMFLSNIYEHIVEVPVDTISSFLCDIGGNLGLALGMSVLSLFDATQSVIITLIRKKHCAVTKVRSNYRRL